MPSVPTVERNGASMLKCVVPKLPIKRLLVVVREGKSMLYMEILLQISSGSELPTGRMLGED